MRGRSKRDVLSFRSRSLFINFIPHNFHNPRKRFVFTDSNLIFINLFSPSPFPFRRFRQFASSWTRKCIVRLLSLKEWEARVYDCDQQNAETAWRGRESGGDPPSSILCQALSAVHHALPAFRICQSASLWSLLIAPFCGKFERPQPRDFFSIRRRTRKFKEIMRNRVSSKSCGYSYGLLRFRSSFSAKCY